MSSAAHGTLQDVSDRQPAFLKDKGDALYKQGNYRCGREGKGGTATPGGQSLTKRWR